MLLLVSIFRYQDITRVAKYPSLFRYFMVIRYPGYRKKQGYLSAMIEIHKKEISTLEKEEKKKRIS